jgi:3-oxoacyl-[acyl-carrier protein] reductase
MNRKGSKGGKLHGVLAGLLPALSTPIIPCPMDSRPSAESSRQAKAGLRAVLVTGASGGIGQAISRGFGKAGWCVGIHYHREKHAAESTLHDVQDAGGSGLLYEADVRDAQAVHQLVAAFIRDHTPPVCFVCCAGVGSAKLLLKLSPDEWAEVMATNLTGTFHSLRAMAPALLAQGGGSIVVLGSYAGSQGSSGQAAYAASKAGLIGLVKTAAVEWGPDNIRVNLVLPGWQHTRLTAETMPTGQQWKDHALGRPPALEEVVRTVMHLVKLKDVSGQVWNCDSRSLSA